MILLDQAGHAAAAVQVIEPPAALLSHLEHGWIDRRRPRPDAAAHWRIVADGASHLLWHVYRDRAGARHRLMVVGARSRHAEIDRTTRLLTVGIRLRPGALPGLIAARADLLTDDTLSATDLWGSAAKRVMDRLDPEHAGAAVDHLLSLVGHVARHRSLDPRVAWIARQIPSRGVAGIAADLGMNERALRAFATRHFGMGLKRFARIRRLHHALRLGLAAPPIAWSRAAMTAGYADQAHFARECRALLGESPSAFARRGARDSSTTLA